MKRVLLTGASGFVGRHAISPLRARGYEVHAVTSRAMTSGGAVHWHQADLLDGSASSRVVAEVRPTHLLHFAWYAEPGKYWRSPENVRWLEASLALLRHFRASGGARLVMAGTCAEYDWTQGVCSEGATPRRPATLYGICKNALHEVMSGYCEAEGLSAAWGRIFFLYGPGEHPSRLVSSVASALLRGDDPSCTHGNQVRDYLHVEDVAAAFVALLDSDVTGALNVASGRRVTLRDIVLEVARCAGAPGGRVKFGAIEAPQGEAAEIVADVRRLANEVRWAPRYDLTSGIAQAVDHRRAESAR
jgi:nucleoside-diphosphate-sugar epimerase